ncbi:MAG: OprO/OprP family phosphate-selective porin [Acidobacteriota bacterium]|nr:OprO/OprP family phosphate-selective porin [Acidobacteriota bacterium]
MNRHLCLIAAAVFAGRAFAQVTPASGYTPPDDTPSFKVGATIFGDYTFVASPRATDADGNSIHPSSFNVGRAYINVTGNLNHRIAYRITPDITRETGTGSSLSGSQTFRLKYAYAQFNLDDWTTAGSWLRAGMQQTPFIDYTENIYRYRFQGPIFADREGFITSSDFGLSGRWVFPSNYGEVHAGYYNGEGYSRPEANDQKALQLRATVRPLPLGGIWKGLRLTAFVDRDAYVSHAPRNRMIGQVTFEHRRANAGVEFLQATDQTSSTRADVDARGWSAWLTPKLGTAGWELLLRHDDLKPNRSASLTRKRDIAGVAYWVPNLQKVTTAVLVDYDRLRVTGRADDTRYGVKLLINF